MVDPRHGFEDAIKELAEGKIVHSAVLPTDAALKHPIYRQLLETWIKSALKYDVQCLACEHIWHDHDLKDDKPGAFMFVLPVNVDNGQAIVSPFCARCVDELDQDGVVKKANEAMAQLFGEVSIEKMPEVKQ